MEIWTPDDLQKNLEGGADIFLKLWKKGCGACKLSIPAIERLEADNPHKLVFAKISTDDHPEILEIADTDVLPHFFVFKNQKLAGHQPGFKGLEKLKSFVSEAVSGS